MEATLATRPIIEPFSSRIVCWLNSDFENAERLTEANDISLREELKIRNPELSEIFEQSRKEDEEDVKKFEKFNEEIKEESEEEEGKSPKDEDSDVQAQKYSSIKPDGIPLLL